MSQSEISNNVPPRSEVSEVVEHLFRHEAGKMLSILTSVFGIEHLNLAEDVVQEALVRALQTWPYYGIPRNPSAWILQVSKNLALDVVRREKVFRKKEAEIVRLIEQRSPASEEAVFPDQELKDDRLRMMFACCHPLVAGEAQVGLALKILCGFSTAEISKAFLTNEAVIAKRLTRAKQKIRQARIAFEIPAGEELSRRLAAVLQTLYLLFNEGYKASSGERLVRGELCQEAIRLAGLLAEHPAGDRPETHALLALMLLNGARLPARVDAEGNLLLLKAQDRKLWDQTMIAHGMYHLAQSAAGDEITEYHLQAGIAACHCAAKDYESTDWQQIQSLYDQLITFDDSPVVALNRAVAVAQVSGPQAGIEALAHVQDQEGMKSYYLLYAVLGEFEAQLKHHQAAANHFRKSLQMADLKSEQTFLLKRLREIEGVAKTNPDSDDKGHSDREQANSPQIWTVPTCTGSPSPN